MEMFVKWRVYEGFPVKHKVWLGQAPQPAGRARSVNTGSFTGGSGARRGGSNHRTSAQRSAPPPPQTWLRGSGAGPELGGHGAIAPRDDPVPSRLASTVPSESAHQRQGSHSAATTWMLPTMLG